MDNTKIETRGCKKAYREPSDATGWLPPEHLSDEAAEQYNRLVGVLAALGTLDQTDPTLLETFCINWEILRAAADSVRTLGTVITNSRGSTSVNPACGVVNQASMRINSIVKALGLSPESTKQMPTLDLDSERWDGLL